MVETWPEEWAAPRDKEAREWLEDALNRIVTLTEDDDGELGHQHVRRGQPAEREPGAHQRLSGDARSGPPTTCAISGRSIGPRVEQVVKGDEPGRNDACPCGSGKKYKKCCGAN